MLTINNIAIGYNKYELGKNQPPTNTYSIKENSITDTFSRGTAEQDTRYSFTFKQANHKTTFTSDITKTEKETLFELLKKTNNPQQKTKQEKIVRNPKEVYNFIGSDIDIVNSNNNKTKKSVSYQYFQNITKDAAKEYKALLSYYKSRTPESEIDIIA